MSVFKKLAYLCPTTVFCDSSLFSAYLAVLLFLPLSSFTQNTYHLSIQTSEQNPTPLEQINYPKTVTQTEAFPIILKEVITQLRQQAYYAAAIDSIQQVDSLLIAHLSLGHAYNNFTIQNGNIKQSIWKKSGLDRYLNSRLDYPTVQILQEALLEYGENNGYPFTSVWLDSIQIKNSAITGQIFWQPNQLIRIGTLNIEGEAAVIEPSYLENYLGIKQGDVFNKQQLETAFTRLQELPFLNSTRTPAILFKEDKANLYFFLAPKKANRFDFLIGVLPNNQTSGKVLITADIDAAFYNQFGKGEQLQFNFEQLRPETQQLQLAATYPYLLKTPLGVDVAFGLYKRDSTYRDLNWNIGLQYLFKSHHYLKAFSQNMSSALLTIDQATLLRTKQLPATLDIKNTAFGLEYGIEQLDYRLNPRKGWLAKVRGSAGFKEIQPNATITGLVDPENTDFSFSSLYDELALTSFQYQLQTTLAAYIPFQKRSTFKLSLQAATILSENPILQNEQFRIGGANLLRGFDEQSIFATTYALVTTEYRYLIGRRSYFNVFGDVAWLENKTGIADFVDRPIGIGAGMAFETKAGVFGITYALGKRRGVGFDFRVAKLHFGLISVF